MKKTAKNAKRDQARSRSSQRTLHLAAMLRRNLFQFVIAEGLKALDVLLEEDRDALCGPKHGKGAKGDAVRWGHTEGRVAMGGQRVMVRKPRVRRGGEEVPLPTWEEFADDELLDERAFEQMVIGVSTRKYDRSLEAMPEQHSPHGASKSAASRRFVAATKKQLDAWLQRDLSSLDLVAIMLDGLAIDERTVVVALGIDANGRKHPVGLWLGATENATVCGELLDNMIDRGLDPQGSYLFVIDGSKALRKAIRDRFGKRGLVQRCQEHKRRNVLSHLPKKLHTTTSRSLRAAYRSGSKSTAKKRLLQLMSHLDADHPDAAASLREGLEETLTLKDMKLSASLERTLSTTNPIENVNGTVRHVTRRVKRWRDGSMIKRWVAAGIFEAQRGFRRLRGYKSMPVLVAALGGAAEQIDRIDHDVEAA